MKEKILLVEDEETLADVVKAYLEKEQYQVSVASTGKEAIQLHKRFQPDLMILDLMLPDISGEEVCKKIRQYSQVPILMLTAKSSEEEKISGLMLGADDYVTKPFSPRELVARVYSLLRRSKGKQEMEEGSIIRRGEMMIDEEKHQVFLREESVYLTPVEFKLLVHLSRSPGRVYSREQLVESIFGFDFVGDERTIDVHIKNLRHKIEEDPKNPKYVVTVYGVGYKFGVET
ncbi:response regulator transcription factor [Microaerobacter geothermalis]|uniref:response regulator transcription factor n=1 Tax=Microaerobacter geothermalis TaxID=674972 RepID=UPI001F3F5098|nr:response regulator transcription factor [Microaerobacter geothermalis]MCF6092633.1 response regulator transcription factor [Microaerobacter geothermalis]